MAIGTPTSLGSATGNTASSTTVMTVTASVAIGEWIFVSSGVFGSATHTATDSGGNIYAQHVLSTGRTGIFSTKATAALTSGVSTITVTYGSSPTARTLAAFKNTGLAASSHFDQSATATGTVAAWETGTTPSTTQSDELIVAANSCDTAAGATSTIGGGFTEITDITNGGGFQLTVGWKIVAATGTQVGSGTWTSSAWTWYGAIATFKGDGGGGIPAAVKNLSALGVG